jgi:hypothetical protein
MGSGEGSLSSYCTLCIQEAERHVRAAEEAIEQQELHVQHLRCLYLPEAIDIFGIVEAAEQLLLTLHGSLYASQENLRLWLKIKASLRSNGNGSSD